MLLATVLLASSLAGLDAAQGRSGGSDSSPVAPRTCVAHSETDSLGSCLLSTVHHGLRIAIDRLGQIFVIFETSEPSGAPPKAELDSAFVAVQSHLRHLTGESSLTDEEAVHIESELSAYDGAYYQIPSAKDLRMSLGFSPGMGIEAEDHQELMRVHMQLALSLSPLTAAYLSDLLGIEPVVSEAVSTQDPALALPSTTAP
jgi:hypothetical protein